jgi:hypothetical protein
MNHEQEACEFRAVEGFSAPPSALLGWAEKVVSRVPARILLLIFVAAGASVKTSMFLGQYPQDALKPRKILLRRQHTEISI